MMSILYRLPVTALVFIAFIGFVQGQSLKTLDATTRQKLTISGFCLCDTRMEELQQMASDLKKVDVEEMDLPKECIGQDSRFSNGIGFSSEKYPGMIFQEGNVAVMLVRSD